MSRDHRKLRVFADSHQLVLSIYKHTQEFPKDERFGLRARMRRAAVSIPSRIVEGNARTSAPDYLRFFNIALGSACELTYLAALTEELGLISTVAWTDVRAQCDAVVTQLVCLVASMEHLAGPTHRNP